MIEEEGEVDETAFQYLLGARPFFRAWPASRPPAPAGWALRHVVDTQYDRRFLKSLRIAPMGPVSQKAIDAKANFSVGDRVRFLPGEHTYGYEDLKDSDGMVPGVVLAITGKRIRVRLGADGGRQTERAVDATNLFHVVPRG